MKKRLVSSLCACALCLSLLPVSALAAEESDDALHLSGQETAGGALQPAGETGPAPSQEDPAESQTPSAWSELADTAWYSQEETQFTLHTARELAGLAQLVNGGTSFQGKTVLLGEDIDLESLEWTPIGGGGTGGQFRGIFDGADHTISNLKITRGLDYTAQNKGIGFFGATQEGEIKNFTLHNVDVTGSGYVAAVVGGDAFLESKISGVHVTGSIQISAFWYAGGILGNGYTSLSDCSVEGDGPDFSSISITGGYAGGIVGYMGEGNCQTSRCTVRNITVQGAYNGIGGINGILHYNNTIQDCTAENVVVWQTTDPTEEDEGRIFAGAFAGTYLDNKGTQPPTLARCRFSGEIYSGTLKQDILEENRYVGSLWYGAQPPATVHIQDCTILMPPVAQIGGQTYPTLSQALDAAHEGDTIQILRDLTVSAPISTEKSLSFFGVTKEDGSKPVLSAAGANGLFRQSGAACFTLSNLELRASQDNQWYLCHSAGTLTVDRCDFTMAPGVTYTGSVVLGQGDPSGDGSYALKFTYNTVKANAQAALTGLGNGSEIIGNTIDLLQETHGSFSSPTSILSLAAAAGGQGITIRDNLFRSAN